MCIVFYERSPYFSRSKNPKDRLELKDSPDSGVYVKDLSAFVVKGVDEMHQVRWILLRASKPHIFKCVLRRCR